MQTTSALYKMIFAANHRTEVQLLIYTDATNYITVGEDTLISLKITPSLFSQNTLGLGCTVSSEIDVEMRPISATIPRMAKMVPRVRLIAGNNTSEWLQKGVYYIDTRKMEKGAEGNRVLTIHGYDSMLKGEVNYPENTQTWPTTDINVLNEIATLMGVTVKSTTLSQITKAYTVQYPGTYTCRETLGFIASMYGGSFIMDYAGELCLVPLNNSSASLVNLGQNAESISFGDAFPAISRVTIHTAGSIYFSAGTDTGYTLTVENPWGTTAMAQDILTALNGFVYQPYEAGGVLLNPAAEIGDRIQINGVTSGIYNQEITFGPLYFADLTAPEDEEVDHEYPYVDATERKITRLAEEVESEFTIANGLINAKVSQTGENANHTFGWSLTSDGFYIDDGTPALDGTDKFSFTSSGLTVNGIIKATSGYIGGSTGFTIGSQSIYNGMTSFNDTTHTTGIYIGTDGISLGGGKFKVDAAGNITAASGSFSGTIYAKDIVSEADQAGAGYFDGAGIEAGTISGGAYGQIDEDTIVDYNIDDNSLSTGSFSLSVNDSLGLADLFGAATTSGTSTYPSYFKCGSLNVVNTSYANEFSIDYGDGSYLTLSGHYHQITVDSNTGKVTIGAPYNAASAPFFNIADTQTYRDGVTAVTVASRAVLYCNATNYTDFDTGFDCDMSGSSYHYDVNGVSYGRLEVRNSTGTGLKTIRVKLPASSSSSGQITITNEATSSSVNPYYGTLPYYAYVNNKHYVYVRAVSTGTAERTQYIDINDIVNYAYQLGGGGQSGGATTPITLRCTNKSSSGGIATTWTFQITSTTDYWFQPGTSYTFYY